MSWKTGLDKDSAAYKFAADNSNSPNRKVEDRNSMVHVEEDWVDQMAVEHRELDE